MQSGVAVPQIDRNSIQKASLETGGCLFGC